MHQFPSAHGKGEGCIWMFSKGRHGYNQSADGFLPHQFQRHSSLEGFVSSSGWFHHDETGGTTVMVSDG